MTAEMTPATGLVACGYIQAEMLSPLRLWTVELDFHDWMDALGVVLAEVFVETTEWRQTAFLDMLDKVRRLDAMYVVIPSLGHLSTHPNIRDVRLDKIFVGCGATVLPMDSYKAASYLDL